jgi:subtilase family serine protease
MNISFRSVDLAGMRLRFGLFAALVAVVFAVQLSAQNVHPLAQARYDQGPTDSNLRLGNVRLMFQHTAAQRAALDELLAAQREPASPSYHQWLSPEQYADRFGLSVINLARVAAWLKSSGFNIEYTARGRDWIAFSGTAGQVEAALHTAVHRYRIGNELHFAAATEPVLPAELKPMVGSILGLNDFHPKSMVKPAYVSDGAYSLAPGDLATIYDINALYGQGVNGTGEKIAIVGQSAVDISDVQQFRTNFGLPALQITLMSNGTPPHNSDDLIEADLDLEWAGAIAPNAALIYIYSDDADSSAFYAIDQKVAPIVSESFGLCEGYIVPSAAAQYEAEAKKANAQGMTWVVSSGDSGAAGCDQSEGPIAQYGLAVNFPASIPEVTTVGGTEFNEGNGIYSTSKSGTNGGSALSYIPEMAWNDTFPWFAAETGPGMNGGAIIDHRTPRERRFVAVPK